MRKSIACLAILVATSLSSCVCLEEYMFHRANDLTDIVQVGVGVGEGGGVKLEATPFLHLGYFDSGRATVYGWTMPVMEPGERISGMWEETTYAPGFILGGRSVEIDDLDGRTYDTVYGDYANMDQIPSNPLHWLFVRGTIGFLGQLDVVVHPGEALEFLAGVMTFDPGSDDTPRYDPYDRYNGNW